MAAWLRVAGRPVPVDDGHRVTAFELFFDLVFVFAFTQVSGLMSGGHDLLGLTRGAVVLGLLWWSWCAYGWLANQARADRGPLFLGMATAMVALFVIGLVIPMVFSTDGEGAIPSATTLVVAYGIVRAIHAGIYLLAAGDDRALRRQVLVSMATGAGPSVVVLAIGAAVGGGAMLWWWAAAWVYDVAVIYLTSRRSNWRVNSVGHFAERYGLIVILALGESVIAVGAAVAGEPITGEILVACTLAMLLAVELWALYFRGPADQGEEAFARASAGERVLLASDGYTFLHYPIVLGIIVTALGIETTLHAVAAGHGADRFATSVLGGGLALYVAATACFTWRAVGTPPVARLAIAPALAVSTILGGGVEPLPTLAVAVLVLGTLLAVEPNPTATHVSEPSA